MIDTTLGAIGLAFVIGVILLLLGGQLVKSAESVRAWWQNERRRSVRR